MLGSVREDTYSGPLEWSGMMTSYFSRRLQLPSVATRYRFAAGRTVREHPIMTRGFALNHRSSRQQSSPLTTRPFAHKK